MDEGLLTGGLMSGYDETTGWSHYSANQLSRYYKDIKGEPASIEDRMRIRNIDFYVDLYGGLHAKCHPGKIWTILSGEKDLFYIDIVESNNCDPEYIKVSEIGFNLSPELKSIKVNKLLHALGFQEKIDKNWRLTEKGIAYGIELKSSEKYESKKYIKWKFELISILQKNINTKYDV